MQSLAKLEEMKIMSRGNPMKIAEYEVARARYNTSVADSFREEDGVEYVERPDESYVAKLEEKAEESGDERDISRAKILRDRLTFYNSDSRKHIDWRETKAALTQKIRDGIKPTAKDLQEALKLARQNSSIENRVLYAHIKQQLEGAD